MGTIIYFFGTAVTALLLFYGITYILYLIIKIEDNPYLSIEKMPVLIPIPIPTKNQNSWIRKMVAFIFEIRRWELAENWCYQLNEEEKIIIPKGFKFDGASIPKIFWAILSPTGLLLIPGLLHDYGYKHNKIWKFDPNNVIVPFKKDAGKDYWDQLFKDVGNEVNGVFFVNVIAWIAVAVGGNRAWNTHRKNDWKADKPLLDNSKSCKA
jgi:hypothetical protein